MPTSPIYDITQSFADSIRLEPPLAYGLSFLAASVIMFNRAIISDYLSS